MFSTNAVSVLTLLAVLLLVGVIGLQIAENGYYAALPSLWP